MCFAPQRRALFDISTSKSGPTMVCFVHFDFEMCFAPQRRANFHLSSGQLAPHPAALASLQTSSSSSSSSSHQHQHYQHPFIIFHAVGSKTAIFDWKELIAGVTDLILQKQVHALSRLCSLGGIPVAGETSKLRPKTNSGIKPTRRTCLVGMGRLGLIMRYSYRSFSILWPLKHAEKRGRSVDLEKEWTNP